MQAIFAREYTTVECANVLLEACCSTAIEELLTELDTSAANARLLVRLVQQTLFSTFVGYTSSICFQGNYAE